MPGAVKVSRPLPPRSKGCTIPWPTSEASLVRTCSVVSVSVPPAVVGSQLPVTLASRSRRALLV